MIKLYKASSLLYQRQNLQLNMRLKALTEIYRIHSFAHLSKLNCFCQNVSRLFPKFCRVLQNLVDVAEALQNLDIFFRNLTKMQFRPWR